MSGIIGGAGSKSGVISETEIDYEEGTWTASLVAGGNPITMNSNTIYSTGFYAKIGSLVHVNGYFVASNIASASGDLLITGLPFSLDSAISHGVGSGGAAGHMWYGSITAGEVVTGYITGSQINLRLWDDTQGSSAFQASEFGGSGQIIISMTYRTSS